MRPILSIKLDERWKIDHLEPFKTSTKGKKYSVVAMEQVTKWAEAKEVSPESAEESTSTIKVQSNSL